MTHSMNSPARQTASDRGGSRADQVLIYNAALAAIDPRTAIGRNLELSGAHLTAAGRSYDLDAFDRILVVGAGKATARMAQAVEDLLGDRISGGLIIVKYGHTAPLRIIRQVEAGHPVPDQAGAEATGEIIDLVRNADERTLVLCLLSGGGSSLLVAPAAGLTLPEKRHATDLLLTAGADIGELNTVRKHLSAVKGGRLARLAYPATVVSLILSDVIGDRLDVIASGPTAPDSSTYADALAVIRKYGLLEEIPKGVLARLELGVHGREEETPKAQDPCFSRTQNAIVGNLAQSIRAAQEQAIVRGLRTRVLTAELAGEARAAARLLANAARQAQAGLKTGERLCLLSGGETTVTVKGHGKGGRNQELALAFALEVAGKKGISLLSAGTDGTDGPTDAAGAIVDGATVQRAAENGFFAGDYLSNNDSYTFFNRLDTVTGDHAHIKTGPTGTNVMDIQVTIVEG